MQYSLKKYEQLAFKDISTVSYAQPLFYIGPIVLY